MARKRNYLRGRIPSGNPSQRPGLAHLCVNGRLICGSKGRNQRYYRSHEYFLNQVEYCPECRRIFLEQFPMVGVK